MKADFKYIMSSWGMSIKISIIEQVLNDINRLNKQIVNVSENIFLSFGEVKTTQEGKTYLFKAIYDNIHILETLVDMPTVFEITEIEYAYSDYQDEAMYCVMINWLNKRFVLNIKLPKISFNKLANRYDFEISNGVT